MSLSFVGPVPSSALHLAGLSVWLVMLPLLPTMRRGQGEKMKTDQCLCRKCGKEIPYWQAHGQPIAFIGGYIAELCLDCRNALTRAIYDDPDELGQRYNVNISHCRAAENGGLVETAQTGAAQLWELQRLLFNFVESWLGEGKAEVGRENARCGNSSSG